MALFTCNLFCLSPPTDPSISWNKLIKRQVLTGNPWQGIRSYIHMQEVGLFADNFTFPILLKAAGSASYVRFVFGLHGQTIKAGYSDHVYVQTALVNAYSIIGLSDVARNVFDKMRQRDLVAWNSMIDGYASNGHMDIALDLFDSMPIKDVSSYNIILTGFAGVRRIESARDMFDKMPVRDIVSWNSVISACAIAGDMAEARALFEKSSQRNVITWNTMISGYVQNENYAEAIDLFDKMRTGNCEPDYLSVTSALSACAQLRSLKTGTQIDMYARKHGQFFSPHVVTALIDMYAKCGSIQNSLEVFYKFEHKDIYCWNAMVSGLALHGYGDAALKLLDDMRENSMKPDDITFIGLLSACSHAGLVEEGYQLFDSMESNFKITPKIEHYGCMVDLLSRAKLLDRAFQIIETMPFKPGESILGALLSSCVTHQDLYTGEKVMNLIFDMANNSHNHLSDGEYIMFSNLYASCGKWEEAYKWRSMMNDSGVVKTAGRSIIEVDGRFHNFLAGKVDFQPD
ncbi:pentatricopeptide repeat-containing protein At3g29230-like [Humulus lupulus]|uniref:pentatricopeptide repeat-containing protein At3g29230-like n=1 Tax=Humulus lupulus TaxID=3486 RepID=UPI002B40232C|nr:pentatricopeptide repeat-containing protein At3g29230-like [Humulus lupulus]